MRKASQKAPAMRVRDMTEGEPIRLILAFAVPLFIGNIFQQVYTMVDTMVVGHSLGDSAIAAVGATSSLYSLLVNFAIGMNSGYGIVVTRCFGARDEDNLRRSIAGMLVLNVAVTTVVTAFSLLFLRPLLRYMNTPESILPQAHIYIVILCGGMLSTICYNMCSAILQAVGNSRSPLYFLIIACFVNIVLDVVMVPGLRMGVAGAAAATVISQTVAFLLCGIYILRHYRKILPTREDFCRMGPLLPNMFSTGFAMALMYCVVDLGSTIFQRANNLLGEVYITAHTASRRIIGIMAQPINTIAAANSTFAGQNWGANKTERIRVTLKKVLGLELLWALCACTLIWLFGGALVRLTTGTVSEETVKNAVLSLRLHFSFFPPLAVLLCLRTAMQAIGYRAVPVISSCIELAMKILSAWLLIPRVGFLGTCITEPVIWVVMVSFLLAAYFLRVRRMLLDKASAAGDAGELP